MSDFFKKIKSVFIEEDPNAKPVEKPQPKPTQSQQPAQIPVVITQQSSAPVYQAPPVSSSSYGGGEVNQKFMDILLNAMASANLDGFDYLEFRQSLLSLAKMPMDEQTRYRSAFVMAQTMGATSQKLSDTAGHYLQVLKNEEKRFGDALIKQRSEQIGAKESEINNLGKVIEQKTRQIAQLSQEIETHRAQMEQMKQDISGAVVKIETTQQSFAVTYQSIIAQIQQDIDKIKAYL
jgi:hypothetical protein